ncbi:Cytoplasmic 60S subunit biogenesis factor ZNF622 [Formica fusca]
MKLNQERSYSEENKMDTKTSLTLEPTRNSFTCLACHVIFTDPQAHKIHYSSEWHRYNLHRKVSELPPITYEVFQNKSTGYHKDNANETKAKQNQKCQICRKKFKNEKQYYNHIVSKTHKKKMEERDKVVVSSKSPTNTENEMEVETDSDIESLDSNEWLDDLENPIERNDCLFCDHHSRSVTRNLKHMMEEHSFFVPDLEYCTDLKGLLLYLGQKIYSEYKCIWCNDSGRQLQSIGAVRSHMVDKGHCMMLYEGETLLEYMQFYDYSSSYPDAKDADPDTESPKQSVILDDEGYELKLPSGKVIGHRALVRYYKQNLNLEPVTVTKNSGEKLRKLLLQYRALGGSEIQMEAAQRRARDVQYLQRIQTKYSTQLQIKQNKLQKHFRRQTNF